MGFPTRRDRESSTDAATCPVVRSRRLSRPAAFWSVAILLVLMLAASGVPSPLYRVYQEEFGFSSGVLTTIFGIYAFALLASLLVVGGLSDHVGRRPVLVVAFLLEAVSMVLFLVSDGVGWLLAARVVQGLATGALTSTLGAGLLDLQNRERPLGAFINSAAPGLGLSLGAVGAGLLVQFVPSPTDWVFAVLTVVFVLASAGTLLLLPETSPRLPGAVASLRPQVHVPPAHRRAFLVALPVLVAAWAVGGLYASLGPSLLVDVFGIDNHLTGGLLIFALNGTGVFGSLALRGSAPERALSLGAPLFAAGVAGTVAALFIGSVTVLFVAAVVTGFAFGAAFLGAVATITAGVDAGHRAGLLAAIFVVGYLAFSVPSIAAGIAVGGIGLERTAEIYGIAVIVLALSASAGLVLRGRRDAAPLPTADEDTPALIA
jgi:predicted MFS family arabinose efflux permease